MSTESHSATVNHEELFAKFYNEDILPNQLGDLKKEQLSDTAPDATSAAQETEQKVGQTGDNAEDKQTEAAAQTKPPSSESSPDTNDWLSGLPEDVRSYFEQAVKQTQYWQQKHQEQTSKNRKLHNELNQLKAKVTQPEATDVRTQDEIDEDWKKLEEADPILAKILRKEREQIESRLRREMESKAREYVEPLQTERQEQYVAYQQDLLSQAVPNWRDVVQDAYFQSWLEESSSGVKALYSSLDARDSVRVLQLYASEMQARFGNTQQADQQVPQQQEVAAQPTEATKLQASRQERLAKSAPIPSNPAGTTKAAKLTPEEMFKRFHEDPDAILDLLGKQRA
jgi:hypothetical protein